MGRSGIRIRGMDEKSGVAGREVVASVVGVGVGVDCYGRGVNGGMVGATAVEVSRITNTGMVRSEGV
ncbi:hypothetical protein Tco_0688101 [Tanacetum coccineum]